ncbi:hypothetical protein EGW08_010882 [Elysia chlorotica]|uniref:Uncharacterized protein n=1 Tax=Elysia chlorotica TaxID=188477 RepID=A0A433TID9_ELYCH|nr:hypothetical protein EGW08_010882 [Elysia chlorotica]
MQSRDVQHRHDNKKREREIISLKERLHQLLADKVPDRKVGMDLRNVLSSGEGRRATWKTNQAKLEEEMYQLVVSNYEERHRELMLENEDLRDCLLSLQRQLSGLLKRTESVKTVPSKESHGSQNCSTTSEVYSLEQSVNSCPSLRELDEGYMQMPFEMVRKEIERIFKETCNQISDGVQQLTSTDETNTDNMTTVTSSVGNRSFDKNDSGRRNQSVDASEVDRLKRQINNYKDIIQQQEELIQQSLHSQSQSVETTFLHESHLLKEKENLSEQKKLFFEEKSAFEKERRAFTEAASRLCKERQAFQEERARILKQHLQNASPVRDKFHLKSKGDIPQPSRMLPATPVISSSKEASGLELTTKLPLVPDNHQNSSLSSGSVTEPSAKSANNLDREGETANSSVLTVQNNPIVHFTPSSQPAQQPSLSGAAAAASLFNSHAQSKADVTPKSGNSSEESASLASIRAARMRIKSAAQQEF